MPGRLSCLCQFLQGNDGAFYSTSPTGGPDNLGTVYKMALSPSLAAPVQLTLSSSTVGANEPVTLTWSVLNGFSTTLQQCNAFVLNNAVGAGSWTGLQTGTVADNAYSGSATITPTADGVYTYALTCGGVESGFASLQVGTGKVATTTSLSVPASVTLDTNVTLTANVFTQPYYFTPGGTVTFKTGNLNLGTVSVPNGSGRPQLEASRIPTGTYRRHSDLFRRHALQQIGRHAKVNVLGYATATTLVVTPIIAVSRSGSHPVIHCRSHRYHRHADRHRDFLLRLHRARLC